MANSPISVKHLQIDKANSSMILIISLAAVISVFSLVSAKALFGQARYQSKVIGERNKQINILKENIKSKDALVSEYKIFANGDPNIIGGSTAGNGELDGDNARIVLDSLPSKYDYPALATSIEKMLTNRGVKIGEITGTDDGVSNDDSNGKVLPSTPVEMAFSTAFSTDYKTAQLMIGDFERSIRPFVVQRIQLGGKDSEIQVSVDYKTYYQPSKSLSITKKVVK